MSAGREQIRVALEGQKEGLLLADILGKCTAGKSTVKSALQAMIKAAEVGRDTSDGPHKTKYTLTGNAADRTPPPAPAQAEARRSQGRATHASGRRAAKGSGKGDAVHSRDHSRQPADPGRSRSARADLRHRGHQGHRPADARPLRA